MTAYEIDYTIKGKDKTFSANIDARDIKSAKQKIGKKHGYKDGRMIQVKNVTIIGYF